MHAITPAARRRTSVHPAWTSAPPSPAAQSLGHLVVEAAALLRQIGNIGNRPLSAAQRRQAVRVVRLAEACVAILDPELSDATPASAVRDDDAAARLRERVSQVLTRREQEVLALLATGQTDRQIASRLGVAHRTATTHVSRVLTKLQLPTRAAAASLAVRAGLA